jgi:sRNA-binding protein
LTHERETLTRRTTENHIDPPFPDASGATDIAPAQLRDGAWQARASRKVEGMHGGVNRIDLDRRHHIEAGLLESKTHASHAREQIDSDWPSRRHRCLTLH